MVFMKIEVFNGQTKVSSLDVSTVIGEKSSSVVYQALVARLSHDRSGNASTLTKSEVRGGGKKPWKQKGLGRARAGSIRSPLWRGGGVTFGPKPRCFDKLINKKQRYKAYISVFTQLNEAGSLKVISDFSYESKKTKDFIKLLLNYLDNINQRIVLIVNDYNKPLYLSSRNLAKIKVASLENIDIASLVYADKVLITEKAIKGLDERFSNIFSDGVKK